MKNEPNRKMPSINDKTIVSRDILIVDDEIPNLKLLAEFLGKAGYPVRPAENPQLAIDSALAKPPALILLDVRMPEMNGFEVCKCLKRDERTRNVPVIFAQCAAGHEGQSAGFPCRGSGFCHQAFSGGGSPG